MRSYAEPWCSYTSSRKRPLVYNGVQLVDTILPDSGDMSNNKEKTDRDANKNRRILSKCKYCANAVGNILYNRTNQRPADTFVKSCNYL